VPQSPALPHPRSPALLAGQAGSNTPLSSAAGAARIVPAGASRRGPGGCAWRPPGSVVFDLMPGLPQDLVDGHVGGPVEAVKLVGHRGFAQQVFRPGVVAVDANNSNPGRAGPGRSPTRRRRSRGPGPPARKATATRSPSGHRKSVHRFPFQQFAAQAGGIRCMKTTSLPWRVWVRKPLGSSMSSGFVGTA
jgi:hypothetical protein